MVNNSLHINDRIFKQELQLENYLPSISACILQFNTKCISDKEDVIIEHKLVTAFERG